MCAANVLGTPGAHGRAVGRPVPYRASAGAIEIASTVTAADGVDGSRARDGAVVADESEVAIAREAINAGTTSEANVGRATGALELAEVPRVANKASAGARAESAAAAHSSLVAYPPVEGRARNRARRTIETRALVAHTSGSRAVAATEVRLANTAALACPMAAAELAVRAKCARKRAQAAAEAQKTRAAVVAGPEALNRVVEALATGIVADSVSGARIVEATGADRTAVGRCVAVDAPACAIARDAVEASALADAAARARRATSALRLTVGPPVSGQTAVAG